MGRKIQAVFFDMGGTIETFKTTHALRLEATAIIQQRLHQAEIDLHLQDEQLLEVITKGLERYKRWSVQTLDELPPLRVWSEYVFAAQGVELDRLAHIAEELSFLVETRFYCRAMRPEMPAVLNAIKQMGLKIGLISNVNSRGQVPTNLNEYGIRQYFDPLVLSSEFGRRKPDPAIFHYAARLANVPASACMYVGDRISRDIEGAHRAGFGMAVQIRHDFDHGEKDEGAVPHAIIDHMAALLDVLHTDCDLDPADSEPGRVRAVVFDAGDILYFRPQRGQRFQSFLNESSSGQKDLALDEKEAAQFKELKERAYHGEIDQDQFREAVLRLYGLTQPDEIELGKQVLAEEDNQVEFFEGVQETLLALKERGFLLGIVTDTANPIHIKLSWFERGGFGHVWDSIISSHDIGIRKPAPKIYQAALQQLGLAPAQALFVGHKASELDGAHAVGMKTAAFNYDEPASADFYIHEFADLLKVPALGMSDLG